MFQMTDTTKPTNYCWFGIIVMVFLRFLAANFARLTQKCAAALGHFCRTTSICLQSRRFWQIPIFWPSDSHVKSLTGKTVTARNRALLVSTMRAKPIMQVFSGPLLAPFGKLPHVWNIVSYGTLVVKQEPITLDIY